MLSSRKESKMDDFEEIRELIDSLDLLGDVEIKLDPDYRKLRDTTKRLEMADPLKLAKTVVSFELIGHMAGVEKDELDAAKNEYVDQWKKVVLPSASKTATTTP